jgi:DNA-binding GntR family transcriptional regulator
VSDIGLDRRNLRLASQVFERLREDIVRGILPPDTPLAELDLCARMEVSRTPVREALIKLAEEGLVRIYPQFGSFVAPISLEAVREGQFVREHLECALIVDAAKRIDQAALQRIRENLEQQRRAEGEGDAEAFYSLDNTFHSTIAEASGHPLVWRVVQQAKTQFDRVRYLSIHDPAQITRLVEQHSEMVDALAKRDASKAKSALRRHLREVFVTVEKLGLAEQTRDAPPRRRRSAPAGRE